ncbi:MAG: DegV family protein [Clostridia bacterium]|nr:DegV family protein [Clostridia bacterium]
MNEIQFTTEVSSDIPQDILAERKVGTVPLQVTLEGKEYKDGELSNREIYDIFRGSKALPSTSAVSVGDYQDLFRPYLAEGKTVIHVAMSSGISSTYQNACIAAEDLEDEGKVYVIDGKGLSQATSILVYKGQDMAAEGKSAEEIVAALTAMVPQLDSSFVITNLDFLKHGGRCSTLAALGANLLKLKPMINMDGGSMSTDKKYRGKDEEVYFQFLADRFPEGSAYDHEYVCVSHGLVDEAILNKAVSTLRKKYKFENVIVNDVGTVIFAHGGPGCFGVFFLKRPQS